MAKADNNQVMASLCSKIYAIMTAADDINAGAPKEEDVFYSFATPGVAISQGDLHFGDLAAKEEINASADFALLVNNIPNADKAWSQTGDKVWDIYSRALQEVDLPAAELSEKEKTMLEKAQNYLVATTTKKDPFTDEEKPSTGPSPAVKAYESYKQAYRSAWNKYDAARALANAPNAQPEDVRRFNTSGPMLRDDVVSAFNAWEAEGNKEYVEQARGIIANLTGRGPQARYGTLRGNLNMDRRANQRGDTYFPTFYFPDEALTGKYDDSWTNFYFDLQDLETHERNESTAWGTQASASWGLWHASGGAEYSSQSEDYQADTEGLSLRVELLQIPILRSWLDPSIFHSRAWKWSQESTPISDGGSPPHGFMPLFPTAMIVARKLHITQDMKSEHNKKFTTHLATQASGGWGPFSVKGHYSRDTHSADHDCTTTDSGIDVPGPQIIAFVCEKLPKSPNPDPGLNWTTT
ncbi:MAG: hypothetical protein GWN84_06450 [Gammaproteobacteria bacterium]|nr:hypothetical protein [Gammaproteobacteria bacterium]NIR82551.1 hypothetical protein [Gammaproteobacteria bacterium]NIR88598.1 hypothetical protein [Gammaproteobacteria bacterium]NIU03692.1 hypothetical protein [Gammaproteobacteria bacterium]NIV51027.1 hypothetical protein [Gammaproteobacteria bacterium]